MLHPGPKVFVRSHPLSDASPRRSWASTLLIVLSLGVAVALVAPAFLDAAAVDAAGADKRAWEARSTMGRLARAVAAYRLDRGAYPSTRQGLAPLTTPAGAAAAARWGVRPLEIVPADPWGHPYRYTSPAATGGFEIASDGADGRPGGTGAAADLFEPPRPDPARFPFGWLPAWPGEAGHPASPPPPP